MGETPQDHGPELLGIVRPPERVDTAVTRRGVDPRLVVLILGVLVATVLLLRPGADRVDNVDDRTSDDATSDDGDAGEASGSIPAPVVGPDDDAASTVGPDQLDELTTGDSGSVGPSELSGLGLQVVVTSPSNGDSVVLRIDGDGSGQGDGGELTIEQVPPLRRFAFDASGQWLAGMRTTENGPQRQVLWAGPVGGDFEPVAIGVRSFSWHDSRPATLAWSDDEQSEVTTVGLADNQPDRVFEAPIRGRVRGWGDWGFAINYWNEGSATAVLSPSGDLIVSDLPGQFNGNLPGSGLVLSGSRASDPLLVDPETGDSRTAPWLGADDYVWSLAIAMDGPQAAALVGPEGLRADPFTAEVAVIDAAAGEAFDLALTTEAFTDVVLSADGEWIVLARQQGLDGEPSGEILAVSRSGGQTLRLAVPDLFAGREWVSALAVG